MQGLGDRLRTVRGLRKQRQQDLADATGINRVTIAKFETGKQEPKVSHLVAICNALGVSPDALLGFIDTDIDFLDPPPWIGHEPVPPSR